MDVIHFGELLRQLTTVLHGQKIFLVFSLSRATLNRHLVYILYVTHFAVNLPKCAE